jgi:nucleoside-diphosphate-sugar epimerase
MNVVVLGGSGQIGASLSSFLSRQGFEVTSVDIEMSPKYDLRIKQEDWVQKIRLSDFVFFLAFDVGGSRYLQKHESSKVFLDNNLQIMFNVFAMLDDFKKPFIFASTQMSEMIHSPYGVLKKIGEFYTRALGGIICRFWNVYGHEHADEKKHVISDFIQMARESRLIRMRTDGQELRQFLYVDDCNELLHKIMLNYDALREEVLFDVSSFEWTSILNVAQLISELIPATVVPGTGRDTVQFDSKIEPNRSILSFWKPNTSLEEGVRLLIRETGF